MPSDPSKRYPAVKPLFTKAELRKLNSAFNQFQKKKEAFDAAASDARKAAALTVAWVGVGEKVVALAGAVINRRLEAASSGLEKRRLAGLQGKVAKFGELAEVLKLELPGIV